MGLASGIGWLIWYRDRFELWIRDMVGVRVLGWVREDMVGQVRVRVWEMGKG